jgi:arylsulfatase A-like enzyme/Flp pilus assembly protein TadD
VRVATSGWWPHGWLAAGLCVGGLTGCGAEGPSLLLVTLDTTRADRIGAMGDADAHTPMLDALAARGVVFERAYASAPLTLPSHTTMLTGLEPDRHGVRDNGHFSVPDALETVAERLSARGFDTAAFVSAAVLESSFGLDQGFAVYDDDVERQGARLDAIVPRRDAEAATAHALDWLGRRGRGRFFLWVHYYDVHAPRRPPPPWDAIDDPYDGALAYVDAQLGRLLAAAEREAGRGGLVVLVAGDHGESLGEHGEPTHGVLAYDSTLHVPLLAAGPGFPSGRRSQALVGPLDVGPTLLCAASESPPSGVQGVPLQRVAAGDVPDERVLYFESVGAHYNAGWARIAGVRTARWKYTGEPAPAELYDVVADPSERHDRVADEPAWITRLGALLAERRSRPEASGASAPLDPDLERRLAALGYLAASQRFEPGKEPDPRRYVGAHALVERGRQLALEGRVGDGIRALEVLSTSPVVRSLALNALADVYLSAGRTADAVRVQRELLTLTGSSLARIGLAGALLEDGRPEAALEALGVGDAAASRPSRASRLLRAHALLAVGRADEAESLAASFVVLDPADDAAQALVAQARALRGGPAAEIARLRTLLATSPRSAEMVRTRGTLAQLLRLEGRDAEAATLLEDGSGPAPEHRVLLARIAAEHGNPAKAAALYEEALAERPATAAWQRDLAELELELGRTEEALAIYERLVSAQPDDAALRVDRGVALFRARRLKEAELEFREAFARDPALPEVSFNLGLVELGDGREEEAERHFRRAIELRAEYGKAHLHLAMLYRKRGDPRAPYHAEQAARFSRGVAEAEAPSTPPRF